MDNPLVQVVASAVVELRNDLLAVLEEAVEINTKIEELLTQLKGWTDDAGLDQEPVAGEGNTDSTGA